MVSREFVGQNILSTLLKCKSMRKPCKPPKNLYNEYCSCLTCYQNISQIFLRSGCFVARFLVKFSIWKGDFLFDFISYLKLDHFSNNFTDESSNMVSYRKYITKPIFTLKIDKTLKIFFFFILAYIIYQYESDPKRFLMDFKY
jgi:hypothetical protein